MPSGGAAPWRLLFVPVSGPYGMGEYARSLALANAVKARWPQALIHFVLSREAPYAAAVPFAATLLPSSPTFHSPEVIRLLEEFAPHVVIFDNAGRSAQLIAAHRRGAAVVFISARARQRRRAFRMRWMRLLDEHWIAYPAFIAGALRPLERLKLRLLGRPRVRYLDVVAARAAVASGAQSEGGRVLFVPGGGTGHPNARDAVEQFIGAARLLAQRGAPVLVVGSGTDRKEAGLELLAPLPQGELLALMRAALMVVTNGGSTLLQSLALGLPTVGVPIADDQRARVARCAAVGAVQPAELRAESIAAAATRLFEDPASRAALARRAAALKLADGVDVALDALARFVPHA